MYLPNGHSVSSHGSGSPFRFYLPSGNVLPGVEEAIASMQVGETRRIHLTPDRAFGEFDPHRVLEVEREKALFPIDLPEGQPVRLAFDGGLRQGYIREQRKGSVVFDLNHPLAGVEITMDVTLLGYE
jgi:FKBP-type peptidyl-prolyl cis-trans isomerase 2